MGVGLIMVGGWGEGGSWIDFSLVGTLPVTYNQRGYLATRGVVGGGNQFRGERGEDWLLGGRKGQVRGCTVAAVGFSGFGNASSSFGYADSNARG